MHDVRATPRFEQAIHATAELLETLRIESIFVGSVARSAWLGAEVNGGAVDVLALMNVPQKNQVAMMASNRGFRVERSEIERSEELDLVPLNFVGGAAGFSPPDDVGGLKPAATHDVRVHVLLASNALYGRMVAAGRAARIGEREIRVAATEDLALMLLVAGDEAGLRRLMSLQEFEQDSFNDRLTAIGLGAVP